MCTNCGKNRPANTFTEGPTVVYVPTQPGPISLQSRITMLQVAADKVGEVAAFTSHLLPPEYDYDLVQEALRALTQRLENVVGGPDALP